MEPQNAHVQTDNTFHSESLESLIAQATARYAQKDYKAAAELYSQCAQLQAELNGEMSTENADLLYSYGRCLYHVAVLNSDVLGTKVAGEKREEAFNKTEGTRKASLTEDAEDSITGATVAVVLAGAEGKSQVKTKPYFQFQGDENFDGSDADEDDETEQQAESNEDEEDDFSNAFEILDLARVLLQRRLEEELAKEGKGKNVGDSKAIRQLKERLADTHDLQAEISLEGEQFPSAVSDLRAALTLKEELFLPYSSLIAETHYKLSLALEFSSVTQQRDENGDVDQTSVAHVDEAMREEAAKEMEAAIACCRLRISHEESALSSESKAGNCEARRLEVIQKSINDVKDMVQDMEQRLVELRQPPVSINNSTGTGTIEGAGSLGGILGSLLGEPQEDQKAKLEKASTDAKDLTNLVKRRKPASENNELVNDHSGTAIKRRAVSVSDNQSGPAKKTR